MFLVMCRTVQIRFHKMYVMKVVVRIPRTGRSGSNTLAAVLAANAVRIMLLQSGHDTASADRSPPASIGVALKLCYRGA